VRQAAVAEDDATVSPETIERGIALADEVMGLLKDRQCEVRERFRHLHKHPEGHRLRVAKVSGQDERAPFQIGSVAPRRMEAG